MSICYTAATTIHEIIHAYIRYDKGNTIVKDMNHNEMSEKFISPMATLLKKAYPNLSNEEATALSWRGLKDTDLYQPTNSHEAIRIPNYISKLTATN